MPKIEGLFVRPTDDVKSGFALGEAGTEYFYLSGHRLDSFLRTAPMLKAFIMNIKDCEQLQVASVLRDARNLRAVSRHTELEFLSLDDGPVFSSLECVAEMLCPLKNLFRLGLENFSIAGHDGWPGADCLVNSFRGKRNLRILDLKGIV